MKKDPLQQRKFIFKLSSTDILSAQSVGSTLHARTNVLSNSCIMHCRINRINNILLSLFVKGSITFSRIEFSQEMLF